MAAAELAAHLFCLVDREHRCVSNGFDFNAEIGKMTQQHLRRGRRRAVIESSGQFVAHVRGLGCLLLDAGDHDASAFNHADPTRRCFASLVLICTKELIEQGLDPAAARAEARRRFGDVREVTEATQREDQTARTSKRRVEFFSELRQDLSIGLRRLVKAPGFSLGAAVLFLTLVALIACTIPALRATRVSPTEALRDT